MLLRVAEVDIRKRGVRGEKVTEDSSVCTRIIKKVVKVSRTVRGDVTTIADFIVEHRLFVMAKMTAKRGRKVIGIGDVLMVVGSHAGANFDFKIKVYILGFRQKGLQKAVKGAVEGQAGRKENKDKRHGFGNYENGVRLRDGVGNGIVSVFFDKVFVLNCLVGDDFNGDEEVSVIPTKRKGQT